MAKRKATSKKIKLDADHIHWNKAKRTFETIKAGTEFECEIEVAEKLLANPNLKKPKPAKGDK